MTHRIIALREQRAALVAKAQALVSRDRKQLFTARDAAEFDVLMAQIDALQDEINLSQPTEKSTRLVNGLATLYGKGDTASSDASHQARAFCNYLKNGVGGLTSEDRDLLNRRASWTDTAMIQAAQSTGVGTGGGFTIPDAAMAPLVEGLKAYGGVLSGATIIQSETGADLPVPCDNETAAMGEIITENSQHNEGDIAFSQVVLQSFPYSSKILRVSWQLMQDAGISVGEYIPRKLGERLGRIMAAHWATGDGSSKPRGVVTAAAVGVTAASATTVSYDELVNLMHSVDPLYRKDGVWLMNDTTFAAIRKLKDSQNRPLYGDLSVNAPTSLLGKPVVIDQGVPSMATGNKSILFGNLASYHIRLIKSPHVVRLEERFADYAQVGFLAFLRADGDLIDGGAGAIKALQQA